MSASRSYHRQVLAPTDKTSPGSRHREYFQYDVAPPSITNSGESFYHAGFFIFDVNLLLVITDVLCSPSIVLHLIAMSILVLWCGRKVD